jgi:AcrR family transcriptional regulator
MSARIPHISDGPTGAAPLSSVQRPKQARSEQTLRRLLDAAEVLLRERSSLDDVSISDIAKGAQSSVGGFYGRFRDKDELLLALHERFTVNLEQEFATLEQHTSGMPLSVLMEQAVALLVNVHRAHHRLLLTFASRAAHNDRLGLAGLAFRASIIERFTRVLLQRREEIDHPEPELAAELGVQMALSFMEQTVAAGPVSTQGKAL